MSTPFDKIPMPSESDLDAKIVPIFEFLPNPEVEEVKNAKDVFDNADSAMSEVEKSENRIEFRVVIDDNDKFMLVAIPQTHGNPGNSTKFLAVTIAEYFQKVAKMTHLAHKMAYGLKAIHSM